MGSVAEGERDKMLDALVGNAAYSANAGVWVKAHLGDPGTAGTANPAAGTTRIEGTFAAASGGATTNNDNLDWENWPATEDVTHVSLWSDVAAGTFLGSDDLDSTASLTTGDTFRIPAGNLDITAT